MIQDNKSRFQQSPSTTLRERSPSSLQIAERGNPRMTMDFSTQKAVVPTATGGQVTMNAGGRPFALPGRRR